MHLWGYPNGMNEAQTYFFSSTASKQTPEGRTNYTGVGGACGIHGTVDSRCGNVDLGPYAGIFVNRVTRDLSKIPDGTSTTLMFGEGVGGATYQRARDTAWSWMGVGSVATKFGLGEAGRPYDPTGSGDPNQPGTTWADFSSRHPSGVNFCFADGSVRMLRFGATTIRNPPSGDWYVLQALAGIQDGQVTAGNNLE
jgi:prepilin-type processing-associated H-X9-DG protein